MFSVDDLLELAADYLLQATERARVFGYSEELIRKIDLIKRAIGPVRFHAMLEGSRDELLLEAPKVEVIEASDLMN